MTELRVWAPGRRSVEAELDGRRVTMVELAGGWWQGPGNGWQATDGDTTDGDTTDGEATDGDATDATVASRYRFSLDGGPLRPDPRSAWQPEGVDGPSAVVDHDRFEWHDARWRGRPLAAAVIYELHVGTFSEQASFDGVIGHLDHLVALGVTAVELLPVAEFSGDRGWGYDGVLLWAPHHAYGGPEGLKRLVDAAHQRGLAVILDVVYNHLGPAGNHLAEYGPYFTDRYRTPWGEAVNYDDAGADEVRRFVIDNALMWLGDYHLDGLRLDAVHAIHDDQAVHLLEALSRAVGRLSAQLDRVLWLIAESDLNDPRLVRSIEAGGYGLDASWSDDFHHALHVTLTGEQSGYYADYDGVPSLARSLHHVYVYAGDYSPSRRRSHGRPVGDLERTRFLGYLQNHDQIGNRAVGERSAALMSRGRLMIGAALVLCGPFVPMLFQGEEWGASTPWLYFTDHRDPALGEAVSEGRKGEFAAFGWDPALIPDPQDPATWADSVLDWSEVAKEGHAELLEWHRTLIALRSELGLAAAGTTTVTHGGAVPAPGAVAGLGAVAGPGVVTSGWMLVERGRAAIAVGLGPDMVSVSLPGAGPWELLLASSPDVALGGRSGQGGKSGSPEDQGSISSLSLPPDSVAILRAELRGR